MIAEGHEGVWSLSAGRWQPTSPRVADNGSPDSPKTHRTFAKKGASAAIKNTPRTQITAAVSQGRELHHLPAINVAIGDSGSPEPLQWVPTTKEAQSCNSAQSHIAHFAHIGTLQPFETRRTCTAEGSSAAALRLERKIKPNRASLVSFFLS